MGMFAKVSFATTPKPLVAIYGVFKEVGVPGNPTVAVRCQSPFAKVCIYRQSASSITTCADNTAIISNQWGLDPNKDYIGVIKESGAVNFIEVSYSAITECNSQYIEIQYY